MSFFLPFSFILLISFILPISHFDQNNHPPLSTSFITVEFYSRPGLHLSLIFAAYTTKLCLCVSGCKKWQNKTVCFNVHWIYRYHPHDTTHKTYDWNHTTGKNQSIESKISKFKMKNRHCISSVIQSCKTNTTCMRQQRSKPAKTLQWRPIGNVQQTIDITRWIRR